MYNLKTPKNFEQFILTTRKAANNFEAALNLDSINKGDFAEVWKITVRESYAMILANNPDGTVKLPEGYTADTIEGEPQLDRAINILNNLNNYIGYNIVWSAFNAAIDREEVSELGYEMAVTLCEVALCK